MGPTVMTDSPKPRSFPPADGTLDRALGVVRFLRAQCPWDAKQTPTSLVPHLLEESREVVAAIHDRDESALRDELGDLLLNLAFQVVLAEERGAFDAEGVAGGLEAKMVRRHPHIFGEGPPIPWRELKARERAARDESEGKRVSGAPSALTPIAPESDPLVAAFRLQDEAAGVGFDWDDAMGALDKLKEEMDEVREAMDAVADTSAGSAATEDTREALAEELGDVLFAFVNVARKVGIHPQVVLGEANRKFYRRFQAVEAAARLRDLPMPGTPLEALDALWDEAKAAEKEARALSKGRQ
jgi:MazG family protein